MKKTLTTFLAAAVLLSAPMAVCADEKNPTTGQVDLVANVGSSYYLQIPTNVDVTNTSSTFDIKVKGDVDSAKKVVIVEDKGSDGQTVNYLVDGADENNKYALASSVSGTINGSAVLAEYGDAKITFTLTHDALAAGAYTCAFPIKISLGDIA